MKASLGTQSLVTLCSTVKREISADKTREKSKIMCKTEFKK